MKAVLYLGALFLLAGCTPSSPEVVVYTSVDDVYSQSIFDAFTKETGIRVLPVYDTEEAKTLGLVHRLIAEKARPQCDVFWSGEAARTVVLKKQGLLEAYRPKSAEDIPERWRDPQGMWTGFSVRARAVVYNPKRVKDPPRKLSDLAAPAWKGRVAIANPLFGTTATHLLVLAQRRGEESTLALLRALRDNGVRVVGGNSHVRDLVARGDCDAGLTDTDDIAVGKARGDEIAAAPTDEDAGSFFLIPNTASLIKSAPHPEQARRFLEWLLRPETEDLLYQGPSKQLPIRKLAKDSGGPPIDWERLSEHEDFLAKAKEALGS